MTRAELPLPISLDWFAAPRELLDLFPPRRTLPLPLLLSSKRGLRMVPEDCQVIAAEPTGKQTQDISAYRVDGQLCLTTYLFLSCSQYLKLAEPDMEWRTAVKLFSILRSKVSVRSLASSNTRSEQLKGSYIVFAPNDDDINGTRQRSWIDSRICRHTFGQHRVTLTEASTNYNIGMLAKDTASCGCSLTMTIT